MYTREEGGLPTVSQHEASRAEDTNQDGDDALELLLHQVTDDLVVEVLDRFPLYRMRRASIKGVLYPLPGAPVPSFP